MLFFSNKAQPMTKVTKLNSSKTEVLNILNAEMVNMNIISSKSLACIKRSLFSFENINISQKSILFMAVMAVAITFFAVYMRGYRLEHFKYKKPVVLLSSISFVFLWMHIFSTVANQYGFNETFEKIYSSTTKGTILHLLFAVIFSILILGVLYSLMSVISYLNVHIYMAILTILSYIVKLQFSFPYINFIFFFHICVIAYVLYEDTESVYSFIHSLVAGLKMVIRNIHIMIVPIFFSSVILFSLVSIMSLFFFETPDVSAVNQAFNTLVPTLTVIPANRVLFIVLYTWLFKVILFSNMLLASVLFFNKKMQNSYKIIFTAKILALNFGEILLNALLTTVFYALKCILEAIIKTTEAIQVPILTAPVITFLKFYLDFIDKIIAFIDIHFTVNFSIRGASDASSSILNNEKGITNVTEKNEKEINGLILKYNFPRVVYSFLNSPQHNLFIPLLINFSALSDHVPKHLLLPIYTVLFILFVFYYIVQTAIIISKLTNETSVNFSKKIERKVEKKFAY